MIRMLLKEEKLNLGNLRIGAQGLFYRNKWDTRGTTLLKDYIHYLMGNPTTNVPPYIAEFFQCNIRNSVRRTDVFG